MSASSRVGDEEWSWPAESLGGCLISPVTSFSILAGFHRSVSAFWDVWVEEALLVQAWSRDAVRAAVPIPSDDGKSRIG